tara:strand:- start:91 stop:474 length:384 start_codon:yes stop_codon:yes gene_type:complete
VNNKRYKFKPNITDEIRDKIQAESTPWANQVYDQAEVLSKLFMENFYFLCEKHNLNKNEVYKRVGENGFKFRKDRMSEFGREGKYNYHPTLIEMCYFSKFFGVSPSDMIGKDMRAKDLLSRETKHRI